MASRRLKEFVKEYSGKEDRDKIAIVTGSNSGIGFEAAKMLAARGMKLIMACRNAGKAEAARAEILNSVKGADVEFEELDLSRQSSVKTFVGKFLSRHSRLDLLVNNGGIMTGPHRLTEDAYEMIFGTNHLGHFTLTAGLIAILRETRGSRVVTVSSIAHFRGTISFHDIHSLKLYIRREAYRQSKLANLLFAYELDRRLKASGSDTISLAVHPGITSTKIVKLPYLIDKLKDLVLMNPVKGALPIMMAATDQRLSGGEFIGPEGRGQVFGFPAVLKSSAQSYDKDLWLKLWELSEEETGIKFTI